MSGYRVAVNGPLFLFQPVILVRMVLKKRAIRALLAGQIKPKENRQVGSLGRSRREPPNERVETTVNRADPQGDSALESMSGEPQGSDPAKREAPSVR
jgi:hypothetical protein